MADRSGFGVTDGVLPLSTRRTELVTEMRDSCELLRCHGAAPKPLLVLDSNDAAGLWGFAANLEGCRARVC